MLASAPATSRLSLQTQSILRNERPDTFWADIETLDLVRLELKADHIPSHLAVSSVRESIRYTMVRIRNSDFLLPRNSEQSVSDSLGNHNLNMISLKGCREFAGESVVTYGTPVDQKSADRQQPDR